MSRTVAGFTDEECELIRTAQGWCPECGGSGMVMRFGPDDCPNLTIHVLLDRLCRKPVKP